MVTISFTKKRDLRGLKKPALSGHKQLTTEVKYPGLISNKRLTWKTLLENIMNKAYRALWTFKGIFSKISGLKPSVTLDLHHGNRTHSDLWLHGMVAKSKIRSTGWGLINYRDQTVWP
jgi:hypothetical protein